MSKFLDMSEKYICPYCASFKSLREYEIIYYKSGRIRFIRCNQCGEKMKKETLINDITPYEWGEWLYLSIRTYNTTFYKFHDKVHMDSIANNFKSMNPFLASNFWDGWFNAKDEWNKGTGNKLLLEIEDKIYSKKKRIKLDKFFSEKALNASSDKSLSGA